MTDLGLFQDWNDRHKATSPRNLSPRIVCTYLLSEFTCGSKPVLELPVGCQVVENNDVNRDQLAIGFTDARVLILTIDGRYLVRMLSLQLYESSRLYHPVLELPTRNANAMLVQLPDIEKRRRKLKD